VTGFRPLATLAARPRDDHAPLDLPVEMAQGSHHTAWWVNGIQLKQIGNIQRSAASSSPDLLKRLNQGLGIALLTTTAPPRPWCSARWASRRRSAADGPGSGAAKWFADPVVGFKDLPLNTTEWYFKGKGIGLVKALRTEPANATLLAGGTMTLELTEWH